MKIINDFRYRPEIDGLRAVAILSVVLFHADLGFSGGYVGVDVFFVISGFLITSLIWKDLESGRFTFANFWERRARRIVPALVVVTIATLVAGYFLLLPEDFKNLGQAAVAQALFSANIYYWKYWKSSGYFSPAAEEMPLLHTWSLAVEEQFYIFIPFLLWGMFRYKICRSREAIISVIVVGFMISFALSVHGVSHSPGRTFYLLPTRAWELLLGSLVAFLPPATPTKFLFKQTAWLREILGLAGLAFILIPILIYTPKTPFPGLAALSPCFGSALLIWITNQNKSQGENKASTLVGTLLSLRPMIFIGLISYSLYLWHWPLLALSKYVAYQPLSMISRVATLSISFAIAILSWKYVETPFRLRQFGGTRKSMFTSAGVGLSVVLICGLLSVIMHGLPQRFPLQTQKFADAKTDFSFHINLKTADIHKNKLVRIGVANEKLQPKILVWGDSHARAALPAIDLVLKEKTFSGRAATHSATAPVLNWFKPTKHGLNEDSITFNNSVLSYIRDQKISDVMLIGFWSAYAENDRDKFNRALLATVQRLVAIGCRPWLMLDVPQHSFDVPRVLALSTISHKSFTSLLTKPTEWNKFDTIDPKIITEIKAKGGRIIDPKPRFLDSTGQYYIVESKGVALYRDKHHLTTQGSKIMLVPFFRDLLTFQK